jgi:hypothetical protein
MIEFAFVVLQPVRSDQGWTLWDLHAHGDTRAQGRLVRPSADAMSNQVATPRARAQPKLEADHPEFTATTVCV